MRTAQLWEKEKGLPVIRMKRGVRPGVTADPLVLRRWLDGSEPDDSFAEPETGTKRRRLVGLSAAGLLMMVVATAFLTHPWDSWTQTPVRLLQSGDTIRALDENGKSVWEREFQNLGLPGVRYDRAGSASQRYTELFGDFDGDRSVETILSLVRPDASRGGQIISVAKDGVPEWTFEPGRAMDWNGRAFDPCYFTEVPSVLVSSHGKRQLLVLSRHCTFFPSQAALLDAATGRLLGEYWHPGHLTSCLILDLDGDGEDEILLGGFNNPGRAGNGHAGLAVVSPSDLQNRVLDSDDPFGFKDSAAREYLVFPNPEVAGGAACKVGALYANQSGQIEVHVSGFRNTGDLLFTLDRALNVLDVAPSNSFLTLHEQMFREGRLNHGFEPDELRRYARILRLRGRNPNGNSAEVRDFFGDADSR